MATKGPDVPHRTPRSRAIDIGTDPAGFTDSKYDPVAGTPSEKAGGHYVDQPPAVIGGPGVDEKHPFKE
jgi:hypothetical protein